MGNTIQGLPPIDPASFQKGIQGPSSTEGTDFLDTLKKTLEHVQQVQNEADQKVSDLVSGQGEDIHAAMIAVEKADLSFQLIMQVRNKIVQAYQEVSRMQF